MVLDNLDDLEEDVEDTTFDIGGRRTISSGTAGSRWPSSTCRWFVV